MRRGRSIRTPRDVLAELGAELLAVVAVNGGRIRRLRSDHRRIEAVAVVDILAGISIIATFLDARFKRHAQRRISDTDD